MGEDAESSTVRAAGMVSKFGAAAPKWAREMAAIAEASGDTGLARSWQEIAMVAERQLRGQATLTALYAVRQAPSSVSTGQSRYAKGLAR